LRAIYFSILRALFRFSARFDNASPLFFIPRHPTFFLPGRAARGSLRHRHRFPPLFSRTPDARFALPQKKNPSTALFVMLSMDSLFAAGPELA